MKWFLLDAPAVYSVTFYIVMYFIVAVVIATLIVAVALIVKTTIKAKRFLNPQPPQVPAQYNNVRSGQPNQNDAEGKT